MKKISSLLLAAGMMFTAGNAGATLAFDGNVTNNVIFGSGNANGGFTMDQSNGIELALRGKLRFNASNSPENTFNSNGAGTYSFDSGIVKGYSWAPFYAPTTSKWNFEWSINTDYLGGSGYSLDDLVYEFGVDSDPTAGTNFLIYDAINGVPVADHSIGNNSTTKMTDLIATTAADYATYLGANNLAQNSVNMAFLNGVLGSPFDSQVNGTYTIFLRARDRVTNEELAYVSINIQNGAIPEPVTACLGLLSLGGIGLATRRRG